MLDFRIDPPLVVKDTPKPRPLGSLAEAAAFIADAMRLGRPPPWRDMYQRLRAVRSEEEAIEVIGLARIARLGRFARTAKAGFHTV